MIFTNQENINAIKVMEFGFSNFNFLNPLKPKEQYNDQYLRHLYIFSDF